MKETPSSAIIGVSFAAFVATILLQKFIVSARLGEKVRREGYLPHVVPVATVYQDVSFLVHEHN